VITVLDPTVLPVPTPLRRVVRPDSLDGLMIAFIENAKPMADVFLDELAAVLRRDFGIVSIFDGKPDPSRVATVERLDDLSARAHGIVTGIGD
jgi:hypothetical protein